MFENENQKSMPVEIVETMVASIILSQGGKITVDAASRDRVNREGLVYAFEVDANGNGVLTVITREERAELERKAEEESDEFIRTLFRSVGMTDAEIDEAIALSKNL